MSPIKPRIRFTSLYALKISTKVYKFIVISLLLDLLMFQFLSKINWSSNANLYYLQIGLIVLTIPFFNHNFIWNLYRKVRYMRDHAPNNKRIGMVIIGLLAIIPFVEIIIKLAALNTLLIIPVIAYLIWQAWKDSTKEGAQNKIRLERLKQDKVYWVEHSNREVFLLVIIPILLIRAFSFVAAINLAAGSQRWVELLAHLIAAYILLQLVKPDAGMFVAPCPRCASWTSKVLLDLGYCISCNKDSFLTDTLFTAKHNT